MAAPGCKRGGKVSDRFRLNNSQDLVVIDPERIMAFKPIGICICLPTFSNSFVSDQ
jgi:hypothetical protein